MILLADLGNRSLSFAVYSDRQPVALYKTITDKLKSGSEYEDSLAQFLRFQNISIDDINGCLLSSVVPSLTQRVKKAMENITHEDCMVVGKELKTSLAIRMDNPSEVGADLIANAVGAINTYAEDCLIIDASSVLSFTIATKDRQFIGGCLFPGMRESVSHMCDTSAQLMEIDLNRPQRLIGKSTKESMNSGIVKGYMLLIDSVCEELCKEYAKPLRRILTGPDASIIKDYMGHEYTYDPSLVFDGLYDIYCKNILKK